jgi:hypothetical protein
MTTHRRPILALVAAAALLASSSGVYAQPVTGWSPIPTLENLQTGLLEMIGRLHLTHAQHEQVERIIANETVQLALTRGNPNLSVAKDIRPRARHSDPGAPTDSIYFDAPSNGESREVDDS